MSVDPALLRALQAAGGTMDMVIAIVEADAALDEERKAKKRAGNRERQKRFRDAHNADNALHGVTERDGRDAPLDKKSPQTPKELIPREIDILPAREDLDLPEGVSFDLWGQYRAMRKKIRKPLTANAERLALKHLRKFAEDGHPPGEIVEAAIVGSYQGLFAPKAQKNGQRSNGNEHPLGRTGAALDRVLDDMGGDDWTGSRPVAGASQRDRTGTQLAHTGSAGRAGQSPH